MPTPSRFNPSFYFLIIVKPHNESLPASGATDNINLLFFAFYNYAATLSIKPLNIDSVSHPHAPVYHRCFKSGVWAKKATHSAPTSANKLLFVSNTEDDKSPAVYCLAIMALGRPTPRIYHSTSSHPINPRKTIHNVSTRRMRNSNSFDCRFQIHLNLCENLSRDTQVAEKDSTVYQGCICI